MDKRKLKSELLAQVAKEISFSPNPQQKALEVLTEANNTYNQFDSALKRPVEEDMTRTKSLKRVQFNDQALEKVNTSVEKPQQLKLPVQPLKQLQQNSKQVRTEQKNKDKPKELPKDIYKEKPKCKHQAPQKQPELHQSDPHIKEIREEKQLPRTNHHQDSLPKVKEQQDITKEKPAQIQRSIPATERHPQQIQQNPQYEHQIAELQYQVTKLQSLLDVSTQEHQKLQESLINEKKQRELLETQIFELKQSSRSELLNLRDTLQEVSFNRLELESKCNYLTKIKDSLEANQKTIEDQLEKLQRQNLQLQQQQYTINGNLMEKEGICERLSRQVKEMTTEIEQMHKELKKLHQRERDLEQSKQKLESEAAQMKSELDFRKGEQGDYTNSLKEKIEKLTQFRNNYEKEMDSLKQQVVVQKEEKENMRQQYESLKIMCSETDELRKRVKFLQNEIEQLQSDNDKLKWKVRKDPNGILSDLKIMPLQVQAERNQQAPFDQLQKQDNEIRSLTEENHRINAEYRQLQKQVQQNEGYIKEIKDMFDRERSYLEDKIYQKEKQINDLITKHKLDLMDLQSKYEEKLRHQLSVPIQQQAKFR